MKTKDNIKTLQNSICYHLGTAYNLVVKDNTLNEEARVHIRVAYHSLKILEGYENRQKQEDNVAL